MLMERFFLKVAFTAAIIAGVASCNRNISDHELSAQYDEAASLVSRNVPIDSLIDLLEHFRNEANLPGQMLTGNELGKRYRNASDFDKALSHHIEALRIARELNDTSHIVEILNQTGTDYRRIGILEEASKHHYNALEIIETYIRNGHVDYDSKKNRVVSLNGIGNIHLTLEDHEPAKEIFRKALTGEKELGSALGQAINYANLGYIFEEEGHIDSAAVYYGLSLKFNQEAGSDMGVSLCHGHFGRLAEKRMDYRTALEEYIKAYDIMKSSNDRWHRIESCLSLARINLELDRLNEAEKYLNEGMKTARLIESREFLAQAYLLESQWYEKKGNLNKALQDYRLSVSYSDSVVNEKNITQLQNLRLEHERERNRQETLQIRQEFEQERAKNRMLLWITLSGIVVAIAVASILFYILRLRERTQRIMRSMAKTRQNFFTNITHEFRTPLTVIIGMTMDLKEKYADKSNVKEFDTVLRNADNLLLLINQLLDIAKINSAIGRPDWKHGDVMTFIRMSVDNIRPYAVRRLIDIELASSSQEIMMDFVPDYINKIMTNLLSNAVKFSNKGDVVSVLVNSGAGNLIITVSDSGTGMDSADIEKIFEPFYQGDNSSGRSGTGIGLPLVKQMSLAMKGRIEAYSIKNKGTSFVVTLPLKQHESSFDEITPYIGNSDSIYDHAPDISPNDGATILIVEDNEDVAEYIGHTLEDRYTLLFAQSGEHGLAKAEEYMPDLIISDVMMPGMDGYEMCRTIKSSEILNHIPVIMITARNEEVDRVTGLKCGAEAYLIKPFNPDELQILVANLLKSKEVLRKKLMDTLTEGESKTNGLPEPEKAFLTKFHSIVMGGISDAAFNSEMIAEKMFMSRSQLNRKVKAITGTDTAAYIRNTRMQYAAHLLASSDIPVGDIVIQCGFESASHFSKTFKQHFNLTPSGYRQGKKS